MRVIKIYSTKGKQKATIVTEVSTWGELKPLLIDEGYDLESLHATENVNKTDLVHVDAALPSEEFVLFLRPKKTKAGCEVENMSYSEVRAEIGSIIQEIGDAAAEHFNEGRNYTNKSANDLRSLLNSWREMDSDNQVLAGGKIEDMTDEELQNLYAAIVEEAENRDLDLDFACDEDCQETNALDSEAQALLEGIED